MNSISMSDSEEESIERQLKVVFIGETNVGKTSIIRRFCYNEFTRQYTPTVGADFYIKRIFLPNRPDITLRISDIGGQELNGNMLDKYLFNSNIIILIYDITNATSFDCMPLWINAISNLNIKLSPLTAIFGSKFVEKYTENIRFCIICNYLSKIIPALQSRCTRFRFGPLSPDQILPRLNYVINEEKVAVTESGKQALLTLANGDMRKVLNVLQSTWLAYKDVNEENVYQCVGHPLRHDVTNILQWLLNENFGTTYKFIQELKTVKGYALQDIITEIHVYVRRIEFPDAILIVLLEKMAEMEYRLASGANENIQLTALISVFQQAKNLNIPYEIL